MQKYKIIYAPPWQYRQKTDGWDVRGNEVECDISIDGDTSMDGGDCRV